MQNAAIGKGKIAEAQFIPVPIQKIQSLFSAFSPKAFQQFQIHTIYRLSEQGQTSVPFLKQMPALQLQNNPSVLCIEKR